MLKYFLINDIYCEIELYVFSSKFAIPLCKSGVTNSVVNLMIPFLPQKNGKLIIIKQERKPVEGR